MNPITLILSLCLGLASPQQSAEGAAEAFLGKPEFSMQRVFEKQRFPCIVVAMDGTVIATFGGSGVLARRSEDAGKTWGEPITILDKGIQ